jgi:hypothetical protein
MPNEKEVLVRPLIADIERRLMGKIEGAAV